MPTDTEQRDIVSAKLLELTDEKVVLALPGTDYRIHLVPSVPSDQIDAEVGKRIRGRIEASALRIHPAQGGGRFIEPVWGHPRIVAGTVLESDSETGRVLIDVSIPMWVTAPVEQDVSIIQPGRLVNFYVESGATFTPVTES